MSKLMQASIFEDGQDAEALVEMAARALEARMRKGRPGDGVRDGGATTLGAPAETAALFALRLGAEDREHLDVAFLDTRHRLIAIKRLFSGNLDGCEVHPRVIAKEALLANAAAVVMAHNHPSGNPEPSAADRAVTNRTRQALALLDVRLLDHIIVWGPRGASTTSMSARGIL